MLLKKCLTIQALVSTNVKNNLFNALFFRFCFKYSSPSNTEDENLYKTIKGIF